MKLSTLLAEIGAALAAVAMCSCDPQTVTEGRSWNEPGSQATRLILVDQSYLDAVETNHHVHLGLHGWSQGYCRGFCTMAPPYLIAVGRHAPPSTLIHEFCHLVDRFHGDCVAALASLGPTPPQALIDFCRVLELQMHPDAYQWTEFQRQFPGATINHPDIIARMRRY